MCLSFWQMPPEPIEHLENENAELRGLLALISDAVISYDLEETITFLNAAAEKCYGLGCAEAAGNRLSTLFTRRWIHPEDETAAQVALSEKGEWKGQAIHVTRDGRELHVDARVRLLRDYKGQPKGFLALVRDIASSKETKGNEAELRGHYQRLRLHMDNSPMAVVEWDKNFVITHWSPQAEAIFGWNTEDMMGRHLEELNIVHGDDIPLVQKVGQALASGATRHLTSANRNLTKDGRIIHCIWYNSAVVDVGGKMHSIFSFVQDITAQKTAERALKASEEIHRIVAESSQTGFWDWDLTNDQIQYSAIYKKQLGYEDHEIGSGALDTFRKLCHPDDLENVVTKLLASQADPSIPFNTELRMRHKNGSWRWIWCQAVVIRNGEQKPVRMIGTQIDLTERKKNEEQIRLLNTQLEDRVVQRTEELRSTVRTLEKEMAARRRLEQEVLETSEREQSRLGRDLHDDLGQQLAGIGMLVQVLGSQLKTQKHPQAADAAELGVLCRNALETTRNLARSFYPVELRKLGLQIAIEALAHRTEAVTHATCKTKFTTRFKPRKDTAIHLYRIVQESITNAIKHGKARNIVIEGTQQGSHLKLTITDDGIGLKDSGSSNGLGLHLFQYRARLIGAKVELTQVTEGGGCCVTCLLPARSSPKRPSRQRRQLTPARPAVRG